MNLELKKDKEIVRHYYNLRYPDYIHESGLYEMVDFLAGLCSRFLKNHKKDLPYRYDMFLWCRDDEVRKIIESYNSKALSSFYNEMILCLEVLSKYYNNDGTVRKQIL